MNGVEWKQSCVILPGVFLLKIESCNDCLTVQNVVNYIYIN